jgi:hypothetical protein
MNAFRRDKEGQLNRSAILGLRSYEISDERWKRAMAAIADSIQIIGAKRYIRFSKRASLQHDWVEVSLNLATAKPPCVPVNQDSASSAGSEAHDA